MTAVEVDHKRRRGARKFAAVLAGLLVLLLGAAATVAAWNESDHPAISVLHADAGRVLAPMPKDAGSRGSGVE